MPLIYTKYLSIELSFHTPRVQTRPPLPALIAPATAACVTTTALCQGCQVWLYHNTSQFYLLRAGITQGFAVFFSGSNASCVYQQK